MYPPLKLSSPLLPDFAINQDGKYHPAVSNDGRLFWWPNITFYNAAEATAWAKSAISTMEHDIHYIVARWACVEASDTERTTHLVTLIGPNTNATIRKEPRNA